VLADFRKTINPAVAGFIVFGWLNKTDQAVIMLSV
jgi:hypothetical protein